MSASTALPRPKRTLGISLKLYFDHPKTVSYLEALQPLNTLAQSHDISLFLIPSMISLPLLLAAQQQSTTSSTPQILLGAQNSFYEDSGAYTGEVSPLGLAQLGCSLVELGHAERRRLFGEDDAMVALKARAALRNGMIPLVCIGEKHDGSVEDAIAECRPQVDSILDVLDEAEKGNTTTTTRKEIIFAYEPIWAIGQPKPAPAEYVVDVVRGLRDICTRRGRGGHGEIRFLYGGSAGPGTFEKMSEGVDGLFLGRFGHDPERVREVIEEVARA